MTCEDRQEQLYLHAAGALPAEEEAGLRGHLAGGCAVCVGVLAEATAAAALLARGLKIEQPPRMARERLMRRVEAAAVREAGGPANARDFADGFGGARRAERAWWPMRLASAAVIGLAVLAGLQWQLGRDRQIRATQTIARLETDLSNAVGRHALTEIQRNNEIAAATQTSDRLNAVIETLQADSDRGRVERTRLGTELAAAQAAGAAQEKIAAIAHAELDRITADLAAQRASGKQLETALAEAKAAVDRAGALTQLATAPGLRLIDMAGAAPQPQARGRMFLSAAGELHVFVSDLKPPGEGKVFELWVIPPAGKPIPAGTFTPDATGHGMIVTKLPAGVTKLDAAAISIEPTGGSAQPTGPIPLIGKVTQ